MIYNIVSCVCRIVLKLVFWAKVEGIENIPKTGGLLLCSNHKSNLDPVMLGSFMPRKIRFMAKEELFKVPVFGSFIGLLGAFPIRRGMADGAAVKKSINLLRNGDILLMFPQGTRKKEVRVEDFKRGAAVVAERGKVDIIPLGISGSYKIFGQPKLRFGKPIKVADFIQDTTDEKEALDKITVTLYEKIKELTK